jgi:hypothetical protein
MTRGNSPFVLSFNPSPQEHRYSSLIRELLVWVLVPTSHFENLPAGGTVRPSVTNYCPTDAVRHLKFTALLEDLRPKIKIGYFTVRKKVK